MQKATFYHAGCPVCVQAETEILQMIDRNTVEVEVVHLGEQRSRLSDAETAGIQSVPALVTPGGSVLHINFGASLQDLKS